MASCVRHVGLSFSSVWSLRQGSERMRGQRLQLVGGRWVGELDKQHRWRSSLGNMALRWPGISSKGIPGDRRQSNIEVALGLLV
jgi:hypothetical protein